MKSVLSLKQLAEPVTRIHSKSTPFTGHHSNRPSAVPIERVLDHLDQLLPLFNHNAYTQGNIAVPTQNFILTQLQSAGIVKYVPGLLLTACIHDVHSNPNTNPNSCYDINPQKKRSIEQALYLLSNSPPQVQIDLSTSLLALIVYTTDPTKNVSPLLIRAFVDNCCDGQHAADQIAVDSLISSCVVSIEQKRVLESMGVNLDVDQDMSSLLELVSDPLFVYTLLHQCIFKYEDISTKNMFI
jgi:hypothetical protein